MCFFFFFNDTATTEIYTLSLHDALPILRARDVELHLGGEQADRGGHAGGGRQDHTREAERLRETAAMHRSRSEEHTSELQSPCNLVCRLLLEKKKDLVRLIWMTTCEARP